MKKICFLVQNDFLTNHFGVRNYFMTIYNVLAQDNQVDFLVHSVTPEGIEWRIVDIEYSQKAKKDIFIDWSVEKNANYFSFEDFEEFKSKHIVEDIPRVYYRGIGLNLAQAGYDIAVITNPWLVDFDDRLPIPRVIGLVYDLIPNEYSLTKNTYDFTFANQHHKGYKYYLKHCDEIMAIAEDPARKFNEAYSTAKCKYFTPFVPFPFSKVEYKNHKKENAIILAAPFDPRKGIADMPSLINFAATELETLYIFGLPRCSVEVFDDFFKKLYIDHIVYYPFISSEGLVELYGKCKFLLFPSYNEGLGFPIIESQVCGCRVITTDKEPMRSLIIEGSNLLKKTESENEELILKMINDDSFDFEKLSKYSKEKFLYNELKHFFLGK